MSKKNLYSHTSDVKVGTSMTKQDGARTPAAVYRDFIAGQPLPEARPLSYGDVSGLDFEATRNLVAEFESEFQALPSQVRDHFENDSSNYLDFLDENESDINENGLGQALKQRLEPEIPDSEEEKVAEADEVSANGAKEPEPGAEETNTST